MSGPSHRPSVARWFDSHCHLQDRYLPGEEMATGEQIGAALKACREAGVERLVCVGTDPSSSRQGLDLARSTGAAGLPDIWATAGLHPHDAAGGSLDEVEALVAAEAGAGRLVAVGECGLDYHYEHSPRDVQRRAFAEQVQIAHRHRMALVIHVRDAWADLFDVLGAEGPPGRTVVHCFTGGADEARRCLDLGLVLSFSGIVTFKNAEDVREAVALCPLDRLMVETDSPFLAPVPHRGRPNEPALVPLVGESVARTKGVAVEEVAESSWSVASALFGV